MFHPNQIKLIELRDRATFISLLCIKPRGTEEEEHELNVAEDYLLAHAGWGNIHGEGNEHIIIFNLHAKGVPANYNPFDWTDRTYHTAHKWIMNEWDNLKSGDVVDVEYILGETPLPKNPQRLEDLPLPQQL